MDRELTAIIRKGSKFFVAECPEIGTVSQGHTEGEALENLKEATQLFLEEVTETDHQTDLSNLISKRFTLV